MTDFPHAIRDYWHEAFNGRRVDTEGDFVLSVVPTLNRSVRRRSWRDRMARRARPSRPN